VKLNPKNVYAADGIFVKELLKLLTVLYSPPEFVENTSPVPAVKIKQLTDQATKLIETGGALFDILKNEPEMRRQREKAADIAERLGDTDESLEAHVESLIAAEYAAVVALRRGTEQNQAEALALQSQLKKKQAELERTQKRLANMKQVKPAFLAEIQKLEIEWKTLYATYVDRFRNLAYLESCVEHLSAKEQREMQEREQWLNNINKRLRDEELRQLRGESYEPAESHAESETGEGAPIAGDDDQF